MAIKMDFGFDVDKARRTVILFIASSLTLILLLVVFSNSFLETINNNLELSVLLVVGYVAWISILIRRFVLSYSNNNYRIIVNDKKIYIPTFYLGVKKVFLDDIYSIENLSSKNISIVLGIKNKSKLIVDSQLFSSAKEFQDFKKFINGLVSENSNIESKDSILKIAILQERKKLYGTNIIFMFCIFLYALPNLIEVETSQFANYITLGAGKYSIISDYQFYRIFSSAFLHLNIFHLLLNLFLLGILGELLEKILTITRFVNIFLLSGISAVFTFLYFSEFTMGVGVSGCIFGLWGAYVYLKLNYEDYLPGSINAIPVKLLVALLVIELIIEILILENVGYFAHIGGVVAGFTYLYLAPLGPKLETVDQPTIVEKYLFGILVSCYALGLSYFLLLYYGLT